jgi:hypothetical protein
MSIVLSHLSRLFIALLLLGGIVVTLGQVLGIALSNAGLVLALGTTGVSLISVIAGLAGIVSFLRYYTREGKAELVTEESREGAGT